MNETVRTREFGVTLTSSAWRTASGTRSGSGAGARFSHPAHNRAHTGGLPSKSLSLPRFSRRASSLAAGRLVMMALWLATTASSSRVPIRLALSPGGAAPAGSYSKIPVAVNRGGITASAT